MWWRVLAAFCLLGLITASSTTAAGPIDDTDERPVVIATLPCTPSLQSTSSGFVIDDETVVTVAHALYETRDFALRDASGTWHRPEILHMDLERDLAIVHVPGLSAVPVSTRIASAGERVQMVDGAASGSLDGPVLRRVRLTIEPIGDLQRKTARSGYELGLPIKGGDSGAAIVDNDDNLIGVVFARPNSRDTAWVTSVSEILPVLDQRNVPAWECARPSDVELILETPEFDRGPRELAARAGAG